MKYFLAFGLALALSFCLTGLLRYIGLKYGIVSKPRERDLHKSPIPRIGGGAIFISFILVSILFFEFIEPSLAFESRPWLMLDWRFIGIVIGGALIFSTMLFDDLRGLKAWQKLLFQALVSLIVIASGTGIDSLSNPFGRDIDLNSVYLPILTINGVTYHFSLLSDLLTLGWMMIMMNVMNFVDGVDGLASGLSTIAAVTIFLLSVSLGTQTATAFLSIILAGASLGFLAWNFPPAKIFMGDAGSMFLGFMLGVLPLISGGKLATAFLVLGFPIIDVFIVAFGRLLKGKNPLTTPDKTHLHHRFLSAGFSSKEAVLTFYFISVAFGWVALRARTAEKIVASLILIILLIGMIIYLQQKKVQQDQSTK